MPLSLRVASLSLVDGHAEPLSPFLTILSGRHSPRDVTLYGMVDLDGDPSLEQARATQSQLQENLKSHRGSLTGAITESVASAHQELVRDYPAGGSISCIGLRGEEIYVARSGQGVVLHKQQGEIIEPDLDVASDAAWLERFVLHQGDLLLVGTTPLKSVLSAIAQKVVLAAGPDDATRRLFLISQGLPCMSALVVGVWSSP